MRVVPSWPVVLVLPLLLAAPAPPAVQQGAVAFEGVAVVPMDRERVLADQTVLVRDGRIVAVGPRARVAVPAGATRVDGRGRWLIPGLADMHVHPYNTEQFVNYLAHGVTTIAVLNGSHAVLGWRRDVARGALLGPTIYTAGPSLDGVPAGNPTFLSIAAPDDGRRAVRQIAEQGFDFVKVYMTLTPETYAAILDEARARRIAVVGHVPAAVKVDGVIAARGQSVVAHAEEFFRERAAEYFRGPVDTVRREARTLEIVSGVKRAGITVIPNITAYVDYRRALDDLPGVLTDPEARFMSPAAYAERLPMHHRSVRPNPAQFRAAIVRGIAAFSSFARALSDSGVPLLLGTDTEGFGYVGESVHDEMRLLVAAGLTPWQALRAGTSGAGDWVAANVANAERFGRVAVGARADLVLLAANPLDDVGNAARIEGVMARGRWLPASRLRAMRDSLARRVAPLHAMVRRWDDLVHAGRLDEASAVLAELRKADAGSTPVSQVLTWVDAQRAMQGDPAAAVRLLEWNASMFPSTHAAHAELARGYLAVGDTARAVASAKRALAVFPMHETARGVVRRIERRSSPP